MLEQDLQVAPDIARILQLQRELRGAAFQLHVGRVMEQGLLLDQQGLLALPLPLVDTLRQASVPLPDVRVLLVQVQIGPDQLQGPGLIARRPTFRAGPGSPGRSDGPDSRGRNR